MVLDNPAMAWEAHELVGEANDTITQAHRKIRKLLWRLGVTLEGSKMSSIQTRRLASREPGLEQPGKGRMRIAGGTGERT
jgi:hypothetical protein